MELCEEEHGFNVVILDTAGRLHVDEDDDGRTGGDQRVPSAVHQTILVVDAMTGQDAVNVAETV